MARHDRRDRARPLFAAALLVLLAPGCADRPLAPIEDRDGGGIARADRRYTVLGGDTLFSIAFRYGLDYRRLAAANGIPPPYTIFPGQTLTLAEAAIKPAAPDRPAQGSPPPGVRESAGAPQTATEPRSAPAVQAAAPAASVAPRREAPAVVAPPLAAAGDLPDPAVTGWRWPASGRVLRGFDATLHKGIDLAGERGDPVRAAASGRVVYAGTGIAGYGLMLILRHSDEYLSAYGHNDELLVAEGEVVRAGREIARRGSSGTDGVKLHFEIRRGGRPVDPRGLLPKR